MWMLGASVNLQLFEHLAAKPVLWKHAFYSVLNDERWLLLADILRSRNSYAARVSRVAEVFLVCLLGTRETGLLSIDNYDKVAGIDVRRVGWLMLAAKNSSNLRREPPDYLILRIYDVPRLIDFADFCAVRLK